MNDSKGYFLRFDGSSNVLSNANVLSKDIGGETGKTTSIIMIVKRKDPTTIQSSIFCWRYNIRNKISMNYDCTDGRVIFDHGGRLEMSADEAGATGLVF